MSDNAASGDNSEPPVHPTTPIDVPSEPPVKPATDDFQIAMTDDQMAKDTQDVATIEDDAENGFDPATLANLAALSRIDADEEEGGEGGMVEGEDIETDALAALLPGGGSDVEIREEPSADAVGEKGGRKDEIQEDQPEEMHGSTVDDETGEDQHSGQDEDRDLQSGDDEDEDGDSDFRDPKYVYEDGRLKRKRNRTVL